MTTSTTNQKKLLSGEKFMFTNLEIGFVNTYQVVGIQGKYIYICRNRDHHIFVCDQQSVLKCFDEGAIKFLQ
jgi:hypothetical protein